MAVGSFSAGLSGLNVNSAYLSVIGNNLANINTVGFKSSSVTFQDLVSQTVGGSGTNPMQIGLGVTIGAISPVFSQGAIENTREATNVAIQGNGFFVVRGTDGNSYTRVGNFTFDADGKLDFLDNCPKVFNPDQIRNEFGFPQIPHFTGGTSYVPSAQRLFSALPSEQSLYSGYLRDEQGLQPDDVFEMARRLAPKVTGLSAGRFTN